jgi:uncharacterized protein (TIGR02231 family)
MDKKVDYEIADVTVYPDRARVTCKGKVQVDAGFQTLLFDELPLTLEVDSVRVGGRGTGQVQILGVDVVRQHYEQSPSSHVIELEDQIELLLNEMQVLDDRNAACEGQAEHLHGMRLETREYAKGLSRGRTTVEDQAKLIQFLVGQDGEIRGVQREITIERRELERKLEKLQSELEELHNLRPHQRFQAQVDIDVPVAAEFQPELTFVLRSAGWQPLYDIRLSQGEDAQLLEVSTIAQVTQRTGQDWTSVQLSVSTARPALNRRLPGIKPWFVDEYQLPQPRQLRTRSTAPEPTLALMAAPQADFMNADMLAEDFQEADVTFAEVKDSGSVVTYVVSGRWDIPSDGSPHKMVLNSFKLDPKIDFVTIPRHTDTVYRRANVSNTGESPMLAGIATLFLGDEFIGKTRIDYTPLAGELELILGAEERIEVERELTKRDVDKRLLRENRLVRYAYDIRLENLMKTPITIEVQDQIPVSRHEQIKIKLDQARPEPDDRTDLNILEWQLALEPGEKSTISYEYVIEHPRSMRISGLAE